MPKTNWVMSRILLSWLRKFRLASGSLVALVVSASSLPERRAAFDVVQEKF